MDTREQFEKWYATSWDETGGEPVNSFNKDERGQYTDTYVHEFWAVWQSAKGYIPVRKMGNYGRAYDMPEDRRAYSYKDQPDNRGAYRVGLAANNLKQPCGDLIDKGLALLKELEAQGYGIFELEQKP